MNELRLPEAAVSVDLQTALTRALDSLAAYLHAAKISDSGVLENMCRRLAEERHSQAGRLVALIERNGGTADFGASREAGFQRLWMTLVSRRFPNFREGLPRECERSERRLERVLLRLFNDSRFDEETRRELGALIRGLRRDLTTLRSLRQPGAGSGMPLLCQPRAIPQDHAVARR
jgi:hypothetical protein